MLFFVFSRGVPPSSKYVPDPGPCVFFPFPSIPQTGSNQTFFHSFQILTSRHSSHFAKDFPLNWCCLHYNPLVSLHYDASESHLTFPHSAMLIPSTATPSAPLVPLSSFLFCPLSAHLLGLIAEDRTRGQRVFPLLHIESTGRLT